VQLRIYQQAAAQLREHRITLVVITPTVAGARPLFPLDAGLDHMVLEDRDFDVARLLSDMTGADNVSITLPASFLIDLDGRIQHHSPVEDVKASLDPSQVTHMLAKLGNSNDRNENDK
jgi:peroxiredoxin